MSGRTPFKHARLLLEDKNSRKLKTTREQMEQHVKRQYSDQLRNVPLGTLGCSPSPQMESPTRSIRISQWPMEVEELHGKSTTLIPKNAVSKKIGQFRNIALQNVEEKIFFSVLTTTYLMVNGYIDTSCQKARVSGFPEY